MGWWADRGATSWLDATLAVVLLTGATALAMIQCRQPVRRRVWGRLGLVASLVVIPLVCFNPLPKLDLKHPTSRIWVVEPWGQPAGARVNAAETEIAERGRRPATEPVGAWFRLILPGLVVAYGCGLVLALGRLAVGLGGTQWLIRQSARASSATELLLAELPFAGPEVARPRILVCQRLRRPVLIGFGRAVILIPPELDRADAAIPLRLGLLHELAHAEIADHRYTLLANVVHAVWFFIPQVWWIRSQLRLDAEFLADHRAVGAFGTSHSYAASLVNLAMVPDSSDPFDPTAAPFRVGPPRGITPGDPLGSREQAGDKGGEAGESKRIGGLASVLFQRVQMLLKCPFEVEDDAPRRWINLVAVVIGAWTILASCVTIHPEPSAHDRPAPAALEEVVRRGLDLAELAIAPQLLDDRPFDLRFRLPNQFELTCEVFASQDDLSELEILGYRLDSRRTNSRRKDAPLWHRVTLQRSADGTEAIQVDGRPLDGVAAPVPTVTTLTIRPIPQKTTRLRDLHLSW